MIFDDFKIYNSHTSIFSQKMLAVIFKNISFQYSQLMICSLKLKDLYIDLWICTYLNKLILICNCMYPFTKIDLRRWLKCKVNNDMWYECLIGRLVNERVDVDNVGLNHPTSEMRRVKDIWVAGCRASRNCGERAFIIMKWMKWTLVDIKSKPKRTRELRDDQSSRFIGEYSMRCDWIESEDKDRKWRTVTTDRM